MRLGSVDLVDTGKKLIREFGDDDLSGLSAELAYRFFLALFPFAIFLAALGGVIANASGVDNPAQQAVDAFGDKLPADAASMLRKQIDEVVSGSGGVGLLSVGIVGAVWAASGGIASLIKAMNRAYDIPETRPLWRRTLLAIGLTVGGGLAVLLAFVVMLASSVAGKDIADTIGAGAPFEWFLAVVRFPLAAAIILTAIAFVYWVAPNSGLAFTWVTPGAVFFTVAWLALTAAFAVYVGNFSSYNATYGALGAVVVLLIWFNLTSMTLLIGAEINALVDEQESRELLGERRRLLRAEAEKRREKKPAEERALEGTAASGSVLGSGQAGTPAGAVVAARTPGDGDHRLRDAAAPAAAPAVTLISLILAAFAIRRLAR